MQKQCLHCKQIKGISKFRRDKRTDDGYLVWCKKCKKDYDREWQEKYRKKRKEYYEENKEKIQIQWRERYRQDPEYRAKILAQSHKWRREHPEHEKAYREKYRERDRIRRKKYHEEHQEEERERHQKYYYANLDKIRERSRRYRKTPHGRLVRKAAEYRRRARLENCEINDFTADQARLLLEKSTRCPICGERFLRNDKRALDHIVPLSKGGNNTLLNIRVSHFSCNVKKGNRHYANYGDGQLLLIPKFQESPFKKPEPIILTEKKCIHCGIIKPIGMFGEKKTAQDGHFGACKRCAKIYTQKHGKEYREKRRQHFIECPEEHLRHLKKQRQWRKEQMEQDPDYYKKLYYKDHEGNLTRAKKHREKHKEYYREYAQEYNLKNAVRMQTQSKKWAKEHLERVQEYGRKWRAAHPDYMKNYYWAGKRVSVKI